jgi:hypothetical protein
VEYLEYQGVLETLNDPVGLDKDHQEGKDRQDRPVLQDR